MTSIDKNDQARDLMVPTGGAFAAMLAAVLGGSPGTAAIGAAVGLAGAGAQLLDRIMRRQTEARPKRLYCILQTLCDRVGDLEAKQYSQEDEDAFLSTVRGALEDDEAAKDPIYVAVLEWILRRQPPAVQVRILSNAIRNLSYLELYCFISETKKIACLDYQHLMTHDQFHARLFGVGLTKDTYSHCVPNEAGRTLAQYSHLDELAKPTRTERAASAWES